MCESSEFSPAWRRGFFSWISLLWKLSRNFRGERDSEPRPSGATRWPRNASSAMGEDDIVRLDDVPVALDRGTWSTGVSTLAVSYRRFELKFVYEPATLRLPSDDRYQHKRNKGDRTYRGSDGDLHLGVRSARCQNDRAEGKSRALAPSMFGLCVSTDLCQLSPGRVSDRTGEYGLARYACTAQCRLEH